MPDNNDNNPAGRPSREDRAQTRREQRRLERENRNLIQEALETDRQRLELQREARAAQEAANRAAEEAAAGQRELSEEEAQRFAQEIRQANERLRLYNEQADAITNIANANKDLFGGFYSLTQTTTQNMQALMKQGMSFSQALGAAFSDKNMTDGLGHVNFVMLKMLDVSIDLALKFEQLEATFVKNTGATRDFVKPLRGLRHEMARNGIEVGELFATMTSLFNGMSEFSQMSEGLRMQLLETAAGFDRLGGNSAVVGETLTKVAGESGANVDDRLREITGTADALGVSVSSLSDQLGATSELFAKFGSEGMNVFKDLAAQAKATGLEVSELYGMVADQDTFEGASAAAGRLNMVLGGNLLDTYTLLNANEAERIDLLQQALLASGQTFDQMDKFQKREIASALNMSLTEAAQLFGATQEEMSATERALQQSGMTQEEYARRVAEAATAMERFNMMMTSLGVGMEPIIELLALLAEGLAAVSDSFTSGFTRIFGDGPKARMVGNIAAIVTALLSLKASMAATSFGIEKIAGLIPGGDSADRPGLLNRITTGVLNYFRGGREGAPPVSGASMVPGLMSNQLEQTADIPVSTAGFAPNFAPQIEESAEAARRASEAAPDVENFGKAAEKSAKGTLAFGAAILMIGAGVAIAAVGIAQLVKAFSGLNAEQIFGAIAAITALGLTFVVLGYIMTTAGAPAIAGFLAFGGAMLMVGVGVGLAAAGMALLVYTFGQLDPTNIMAIAGAFGTISFAIMGMASSSIGFLIAAAGIATIASAINSIDTEKANAYSGVLTAIKNLATSGFETGILDSALSFIEGSAEAISNVPADAAEKFSATINSLNELMRLTIAVDDSKLQNLKAIAEAVAQTEGEGGPAALANSIREFLVRMDANQEIVVKLDSHQLARWMNNRSNRQVRLNTQ